MENPTCPECDLPMRLAVTVSKAFLVGPQNDVRPVDPDHAQDPAYELFSRLFQCPSCRAVAIRGA
jgi:hypothetical protein